MAKELHLGLNVKSKIQLLNELYLIWIEMWLQDFKIKSWTVLRQKCVCKSLKQNKQDSFLFSFVNTYKIFICTSDIMLIKKNPVGVFFGFSQIPGLGWAIKEFQSLEATMFV